MKEYSIRTLDETGEVVRESKISCDEKDIILLMPKEHVPMDMLKRIHDYVADVIEKGTNLLTLPEGMDIKVLSVR